MRRWALVQTRERMSKKRARRGRKRTASSYRELVEPSEAGEGVEQEGGEAVHLEARGGDELEAPADAEDTARGLGGEVQASAEDELEIFSEPPPAGDDEGDPESDGGPVRDVRDSWSTLASDGPETSATGSPRTGAEPDGDGPTGHEPRAGTGRQPAAGAVAAAGLPAKAALERGVAARGQAETGEQVSDPGASEAEGSPSAESSMESSTDRKPKQRPLRIIAIGGARGGVGKTMLAVNLGLYLATIGRKVVLVDADAGGASIHTGLGSRLPPSAQRARIRGPGDMRGDAQGSPVSGIPSDLLVPSNFQGLQMLYAGVDEPAAPGSRGERLTDLMAVLRGVDAEYAVVDLGVGLSKEVLDAFLDADIGLYITVPEPTAIENTYRFLRGAFVRFLLRRELTEESRAELEGRLKRLGGAPPPLDLLDELEREHHALGDTVREAMQAFTPRLAINQTRLRADLELGFAMQSAARRRLGVRLDYLGHVDHDDTVWTCVRNRRPVLLDVPGAKSSKKIEKLARRLLLIEAGKDNRTNLPSVPQHSHHDMLELDRGATDEEVRRAYKRAREVYSHEALCCYGLLEPNEIEKLRARIDEAFDVLLDPARRRPYELSVFADDTEPVPSASSDEEKLEPGRSMPALDPDTQFTGALLRDVREARRVTLREISQRTKVGIAYLKAIESEDFGKLPAVVYTTGFVTELARYLKLDSRQVSRTYVQRYKTYIEGKQRGLVRRP